MSAAQPRRPRRLAVAALLCVAGLAAIVAMFNRTGDTQVRIARLRAAGYPVTGSELDAWYVHPPDHENLATPLLEAGMKFRFDSMDPNLPLLGRFRADPDDSPWPPHVLHAARECLRRNSIAVYRLHTALERPKSRYPINLTQGYQEKFSHLGNVSDAGKALALEACVAAEDNRPDKAVNAILLAQHLADTLEAEPAYASYRSAMTIRWHSLHAAEFLLRRCELSPTNLLRLQERLLASAASTSPERGIAGDMVNWLDWAGQKITPRDLDAFGTKQGAVLSLYWRVGLKHRDLRLGIRYFDDMLAALRLPADQRAAAGRGIEDEFGQRLSHGLHPLAFMMLTAGSRIACRHATDLTRLRAAATACAIERFRQSEGHLPESLEALVPAFMTSVPTDAFTGRSLSYRRLDRGFVVYGVGEDGVDNGGLPRERRPNQGDRSFDDTFTVSR
ncbi:MAG: hypothetical protein J0L84_18865 [Verrucomicrobia bacterium]|nr:hypothetical protein [Verrucomicrobiota bacterium]